MMATAMACVLIRCANSTMGLICKIRLPARLAPSPIADHVFIRIMAPRYASFAIKDIT
jgi:hypothetical protein